MKTQSINISEQEQNASQQNYLNFQQHHIFPVQTQFANKTANIMPEYKGDK
jgi:hypothetical protein